MPFCLVCTVLSWGLIIAIMKPDDIQSIPVIVYEPSKSFGKRNVAVVTLSLITIFLFAVSSWTKNWIGDVSIIGLAFVGIMFGTGMLTEVRCHIPLVPAHANPNKLPPCTTTQKLMLCSG